MKKGLCLLSLCLVCITAMAQKPYTIYDWTGHVRMKEYKGQQWMPVQKNQGVTGVDSVDIDKKGSLRIIDSRSNLIYKSTSTGKMRVLTIINDAKKQNSRTLAAVNQELMNSAKTATQSPTMQVVGATTRASDDDRQMDSILSTFGWLANQAQKNELKNNATDFILNSYPTPEGTYFDIKNMSDRGYFVNVLHLDKQTKKINLCYIIEQVEEPDAPYIFLPQGETIQMKGLIFNYDAGKDLFLLVGTEDKFIPEQMQSEMQYMDIETAQPLYHKYKYYKK